MPDFLDTFRTALSGWIAAAPMNLSQAIDLAIAHPIISFEIICVTAIAYCARTGARI